MGEGVFASSLKRPSDYLSNICPKPEIFFVQFCFFVKALPSHTMAFTGFIVEVLKCSAAAKDRMVQTKQGRRCVEGRLFKSFSTIRIGGEFFSEEAILYPTS